MVDQGAGKGDALALSAGELGWLAMSESRQAHQVQHLIHLLVALLSLAHL